MNRQDNAREHYRITYPTTARPVFREFGARADHTVADCSERGIRYRSVDPRMPPLGSEVEGTVVFPDGTQVRVSGVVVRARDGEVALHLTREAIPFPVIIQQQRYLRQNFPLNELMV